MKPAFKPLILFAIVIVNINLHGQNLFREFLKVSPQEKCWAINHPFVAKQAYEITQQTRHMVDSLKGTYFPDTSECDGMTDALRHTLWMALLSSRISPRKACKLGCAHETANFPDNGKPFQKGDCLHDSAATAMDIHNNKVGIRIGMNYPDSSAAVILDAVVDSLAAGNCRLIYQDDKGSFLDRNSKPIKRENLEQKWITPRVLVPTYLPANSRAAPPE